MPAIEQVTLGKFQSDFGPTSPTIQTIAVDELSVLLGYVEELHSTDGSSDEFCSSPATTDPHKSMTVGKRKRSFDSDDDDAKEAQVRMRTYTARKVRLISLINHT
ncbi:hypothetical protein DVH05_006349 [Phytophthora capsici]|nr:hypothetical protein DVH05_006349 [Phytophthora capsici]